MNKTQNIKINKNNEKDILHDYVKNNFLSDIEEKYLNNSEFLKIKQNGINNIISKIDKIYDVCKNNNLLGEKYSDNFCQYLTELYVGYVFYNNFEIKEIKRKLGKKLGRGKTDFYFDTNGIRYWIEATTSNQGCVDKNKVPNSDSENFENLIINKVDKKILNRIEYTLSKKQEQKLNWQEKQSIDKNDKLILSINVVGAYNCNYQQHVKDHLYKQLFFTNVFDSCIKNFLITNDIFCGVLIFNLDFLDACNDYTKKEYFTDCILYTSDIHIKSILEKFIDCVFIKTYNNYKY